MITQELLDYIKTQVRQGMTQQDIVQALRNVGWQENVIQQALGSFENAIDSMMPPSAPLVKGINSTSMHDTQPISQMIQEVQDEPVHQPLRQKSKIEQLREIKSQSMIMNPHIHTIAKQRPSGGTNSIAKILLVLIASIIGVLILLTLLLSFKVSFPGAESFSKLPLISSLVSDDSKEESKALESEAPKSATFTEEESRAISLLPSEMQKEWITPENLMAHTFDDIQNKHLLSFTTIDPLQYIIEVQDAMLLDESWTQEFSEDTVFFDRKDQDGSAERISLRPFEANVSVTYQKDMSQFKESVEVSDQGGTESTTKVEEAGASGGTESGAPEASKAEVGTGNTPEDEGVISEPSTNETQEAEEEGASMVEVADIDDKKVEDEEQGKSNDFIDSIEIQ